MDKVFINDRPLFFTADIEVELANKLIEYESEESVLKAIELLEKGFVQELFLFHADIQALKSKFLGLFHPVEAAGGVVKNKKGNILFIFRHGKWDLPKGKLEQNEDPETCALREVEEECGIGELKLTRSLCSTYHSYIQDKQRNLKHTYWYEMEYMGNDKPKPQLEEHITAAAWLNKGKLTKALSNTYNSIREVISCIDRIDQRS